MVLESCPHGLQIVHICPVVNEAVGHLRIDAMVEFRFVFDRFDSKENHTQHESDEQENSSQFGFVFLGGFEREHNRHTGADQHKGIECAVLLDHMHIVWSGPSSRGSAEADDDVSANQCREEHDLRRKKEPKTYLAVGNWERGLIFQLDMSVISVIVCRICHSKLNPGNPDK